jgi:hypothetical protein
MPGVFDAQRLGALDDKTAERPGSRRLQRLEARRHRDALACLVDEGEEGYLCLAEGGRELDEVLERGRRGGIDDGVLPKDGNAAALIGGGVRKIHRQPDADAVEG